MASDRAHFQPSCAWQGCRLMTHAPQLVAAKELFDAITKMEPSYAEASDAPVLSDQPQCCVAL